MNAGHKSRNGSNGAAMRCVILAPSGDLQPKPLLAGLRRRGVGMVTVNDPATALAELAQHPHQVLILIEPTLVRRLDEFTEVIQLYFPAIRCWQYVHSSVNGNGTLQPLILTKSDEALSTIRIPCADPNPQSTAPSSASGKSQIDVLTHPPLVTQEELAILLGPWPSEGQPPRHAVRDGENRR